MFYRGQMVSIETQINKENKRKFFKIFFIALLNKCITLFFAQAVCGAFSPPGMLRIMSESP